jgi:uncharacterized protein (TIGR02001 family)
MLSYTQCLVLITILIPTINQSVKAEVNELAGGKVSGKFTLASDYVFRSESETADGDIPAIQANLTWTHNSDIYAGIFGSTNKFTSSPDIYAVVAPYIGKYGEVKLLGIKYNVFWFSYLYPGASQYNYSELWMQVSKSVYDVDLGLEITPTTADWFGVEGWSGVNYAISFSWKYRDNISFSAVYGKQKLSGTGAQGWNHWNVGLDYEALSSVFGLHYHDSNIDENHKVYGTPAGLDIFDERVVLSLSKSF